MSEWWQQKTTKKKRLWGTPTACTNCGKTPETGTLCNMCRTKLSGQAKAKPKNITIPSGGIAGGINPNKISAMPLPTDSLSDAFKKMTEHMLELEERVKKLEEKTSTPCAGEDCEGYATEGDFLCSKCRTP